MPTVWIGGANGGAWPYWTGTGTATTQVVDCWPDWTQATGGTTAQITQAAWVSWTTATTAFNAPAPYRPPERSPRDVAILRTRQRAAAMRERVARRRAERLLLEHLDDEQRAEWERSKVFHVETADGTRRYRIRRGLAGNVELVRDGEREAPAGARLARYCMHVYPPEPVPVEDNVLAQKLLLDANEAEFLRMANVS